jgi:hypothetical protein
MEQIMLAFKTYQFNTIDDAIYYMMFDTDTRKYLHVYSKIAAGKDEHKCGICGGRQTDHINIEDGTSQAHERFPYKKVEIAREVLNDFEDPNTCQICFDSNLKLVSKTSFDCGHQFCNSCIKKYLTTNIINGKVNIYLKQVAELKCLYGGCPREFTKEEIRKWVDQVTFCKYLKFTRNQYLNSLTGKNIYFCPYPDCEEAYDLDPYASDTFVECESKHKSCSKCRSLGWHQNGKCTQVIYL